MSTRVLYVDDEDTLRFLVKEQLSAEGFDVVVAEDGLAAMECMREQTFDVVLLDILMPGLDGFAVLREMRNRPKQPRVIMLTGVSEISTAVESLKRGANDYITKPYDLKDLISCINRVLAK